MKTVPCLMVVATLLLVSTVESKYDRNYNKHFEIYKPKGLTVWYPRKSELMGFSVKIILSPSRGSNDCHHRSLNTTTVSYGKFIIHDENAVIHAEDNFKYRFEFLMINGQKNTVNGQFRVAAHKIVQQQRCSSTASAPTTKDKLATLEDEIKLMEVIVEDVFKQCKNVTDISKNLYLVSQLPPNLDSEKLHEFTLNELQLMLPNIAWNTVLRHTFVYKSGVGFEVATHIDKLKVLKLSRYVDLSAIIDMDELDQSTDISDSTEDYFDVFSSSGKAVN